MPLANSGRSHRVANTISIGSYGSKGIWFEIMPQTRPIGSSLWKQSFNCFPLKWPWGYPKYTYKSYQMKYFHARHHLRSTVKQHSPLGRVRPKKQIVRCLTRETGADSLTTLSSSFGTTMSQPKLTVHKQSSAMWDGQPHNMPCPKQPSVTNRPQQETVEHSQLDMRSNTKHINVLIFDNSHICRINAKKMYQKKSCEVASLDNKSINGAASYVRRCPLKPKTVVMQVLSNDLTRYSVDDCLHNAQSLIDLWRNTFPQATVFMSKPLPRITNQPVDYNTTLQ